MTALKKKNNQSDTRGRPFRIKRSRRRTDLVGEFVFLLIVERQLVVEDVVQILLHEGHRVGEAVLLVVSAVVHVGVVAEDGIGGREETSITRSERPTQPL